MTGRGNCVDVRTDAENQSAVVSWAKKVVLDTLVRESQNKRQVSVLLTDNRHIRKINKLYLSHDWPTDVISFWFEQNTLAGKESDLLGDLVVSAQMARQKAKELRISFKEELARYLVHGTLHLLGYRDEKKKDKAVMDMRQEALLRKLLHPNAKKKNARS